MHRFAVSLAIAGLAVIATPVTARTVAQKPLTEWEFLDYYPDLATIESRLDADVNGDAINDVIAVCMDGDKRSMVVLASQVSRGKVSYHPIGQMTMDPNPVAAADLMVEKGVLMVQDVTGGTSAVSSLHRFRYDPRARRMLLIGDDVELTSSIWAHGGLKISTDRISGRQTRTEMRLAGKGESSAYWPQRPVTASIARSPLYMEQAPVPAKTLGWRQ